MISRRALLKSTGALLVPFSLTACKAENNVSNSNSSAGNSAVGDMNHGIGNMGHTSVGNWLKISADGSVQLSLGKVELGQGIGTALAQLAAEALDVNFSRISITAVDTDYSPDQAYTFSSISVQQSGPAIEKAASAARRWMAQLAAKTLAVEIEELSVSDGEFYLNSEKTEFSYWQLVDGQNTTLTPDKKLPQSNTSKLNVVGKSVPRIDIPGKIFGAASYLQDVRLDNMLHARIVRPPAPRATLTKFDPAVVKKNTGVTKVIRDGNFVAVIANREEQARRAATMLADSSKWAFANDLPSDTNIYDWLKSAPSKLELVAERSNPTPQNGTRKTLQAIYQRPYQCHASISPSAAIALFENQTLTVWSHAQGMYPLRKAIASSVGLSTTQVRCIHAEASGCYGHNGADDAACEAAVLAMQQPGRPIRLQWERADEFLLEPYGSAMHIETSAELDDDGVIQNWQYDLWSCPHSGRPTNDKTAGNLLYNRHRERPLEIPPPRSIPQPNGGADRNAVPLYAFSNMQVQKHLVTEVPLRTSALRGLGAYANVFAIESFMDELANEAGQDPLDFRIRHLEDPRAIAVLRKLDDISDWRNRPSAGSGAGWGLGFAQFKNQSSYLAVNCELEVSKNNSIMLKRFIAVCDAGLVINPDGLRAQIEGGIIQSASWTLKEALQFDEQKVHSNDWASYPILRFDEIPEIETHLMPANGNKSLGVGETAQGPAAAAIANAIFHATNKRLRQLPFTPEIVGA